jgi:hypothetical protein
LQIPLNAKVNTPIRGLDVVNSLGELAALYLGFQGLDRVACFLGKFLQCDIR